MKRILNSKYFLAGGVSLITFAVYLSSLRNGFVEWDDSVYIFENPHIHSFSADFFRWAFLDFYAGNWHPLTWISHAIDYAVWGLNPMGHHLTNNIFHAINTFVVVVLVMRLIGVWKETTEGNRVVTSLDERVKLITAGVTGLLFGLHPLHVESAAWVSERKELLCASFFLLSLTFYTKYVNSASNEAEKKGTASRYCNKYYLFTFGFFILALLSKPMAVSLPAVLLILDWYPSKRIRSFRSFRTALMEKLPFVALGLISAVMTIFAQQRAIAPMNVIPLSTRVLVAAQSLISYLWKMIVPLNLIPFYPYPKNISILSLQYLSAVVLVIAITAGCIVMTKKKLWLAVWSYYVVTLIPVLGIIQVGSQAMADRYAYLPSLGPFMVMGFGVAWVWSRQSVFKKRVLIFGLTITVGICAAVFMIYLTIGQTGIWKNSFTLWNYVIEKGPIGIPVAHNSRGVAYGKTSQFDKAIADFTRAIELNPSYYEAYNNRALIFEKMGQFDKAIADFTRAIELNPSYYEAYNNRALVFGKMGQFDKAMANFTEATALNPSYYKAYNNQGVLYGKAGLYDKAIELGNKAIAANPYFPDAYFNRGLTYFFVGKYDRALEDFHKTVELDRNYVDAYFYRADVYLKMGNKEFAAADFRKACDLGNKDSCEALHTLRTVITDQGK